MLDLLSMMTLVCIAVGAVTAIPREYHDDRVFVAFLCGGIALGMGIGRISNKSGIFLGTFTGTIAAGTVWCIFKSTTWLNRVLGLGSVSPYKSAPWQAIVLSIALSCLICLIATSCYALTIWLARNGLRKAIAVFRLKPWRWSAIAIFSLSPLLASIAIDRWYFAGGPSPNCRLMISEPTRSNETPVLSDAQIVVSPKGRWWAVRLSRWWIVYEHDGNRLVKCRALWNVEGRPTFSPDEEFCAYRAGYSKAIVQRASEDVTVCQRNTQLPRREAQSIYWLANGKLLMNEGEKLGTGVGVWNFNEQELERETFFSPVADGVPIAVGPELQWMAERQIQAKNLRLIVRSTSSGEEQLAQPSPERLESDFDPRRMTSDAQFLVGSNSLFDLNTGGVDTPEEWQLFHFTSRDLLLATRSPYEWLQNASAALWLKICPESDVNPTLDRIPLGRIVRRALTCQQVIVVDPASMRLVAKQGAVRGQIIAVTATQDNRYLGALIETESPDRRKRLSLQIWTMP